MLHDVRRYRGYSPAAGMVSDAVFSGSRRGNGPARARASLRTGHARPIDRMGNLYIVLALAFAAIVMSEVGRPNAVNLDLF